MPTTSLSTFAELLRAHRLAAGISQAELAERAGLSLRGVSDLERGARRTPYLDTVQRLAAALGLSDSDRRVLVDVSRHGEANQNIYAVPAELPVPLTTFVGRGSELASVERHLHTHRLVTLTGPGGIGKTRLALEAARQHAPEHPDGVAFVDLSASTAERVAAIIGAALGIREPPRGTLLETLADALRPRDLLLVLDNCEHVLDASARAAAALLRGCPRLRILATSREPLGLAGEVVWSVPPLGLPTKEAQARIQDVVETPAVRLFMDRVRAARPDYLLTDQEPVPVQRARPRNTNQDRCVGHR